MIASRLLPVLLLLLLGMALPLQGQTDLPAEVTGLMLESSQFMNAGNPQAAIALAEKAISLGHQSIPSPSDIRHAQLGVWLGQQYLIAGQYREAEQSSRLALQSLMQHHPKQAAEIAQAKHALALVLLEIGAGEEAAKELEAAMRLQPQQNAQFASNLEQLAGLELLRGNDKAAESHYLRLLKLQDSIFGSSSPELARILNNLAGIHQQRGLDETARGMYLQALNIQDQAFGKNSLEASTTLTNLAVLHDNQGEFDLAKTYLEQAFAIRKAHPAAKEMYWAGLDNLVSLYIKHNRPEKALELLRQTEQEILSKEGGFCLTMASLMDRFATYCIALQDAKSAQTFFLKALEIRESLLGAQHLELAPNLYNLGKLENAMNQADQARIHLNWGLDIYESQQMGNEAQVTALLAELFSTDYMQGKLLEAENDLLMMREVKRHIYGEDHPETLSVMQEQARFLRLTGREAEAELMEAQILSKASK